MQWHYSGLWGLLILAADLWALLGVLKSAMSPGKKLLWVVLIVLLPVLGVVLWLLLGPRDG